MPTREFIRPTVLLGLQVDKGRLADRIGRRVDLMWDRGLRAETEQLLTWGLRDGVTASRAIGYKQAIAVIEGRMIESEARAATALATRRYARRQEAWFRPEPRVVWLDAEALAGSSLLDSAMAAIASHSAP